MRRRPLLLLLLASLPGLAAGSEPPRPPGVPRPLLPIAGEAGAALAVLPGPAGPGPGAGGVAVGDGAGLRILGAPGRALSRGPVRGLCASASGGLFVLLPDALLFREPGGDLHRVASLADPAAPLAGPGRGAAGAGAPAGRAGPGPARSLACVGELAVVAGRRGLELLARDGSRYGPFPLGGVRGVRLVRASPPEAGFARIAAASEREVVEARLEIREGRPRLAAVRRRFRAGPGPRERVVDVALPAPGAVLVLTEGALHELRDGGRWERPLALRPGARGAALAAAPRAVVVATTGGFLVAAPPEAPLRPAPGPPGRRAGLDAAVRGSELLLLGRRWLWSASIGPAEPPSPSVARISAGSVGSAARALLQRGDPPVEAVHRAALRYLGLRARDLDGLRRDAARRGRFPELDFELYGGRDRRRNWERDEAFLSGARRVLHDRDVDRDLEYGARLRISVDLRDAVFDPERIDASRELRALLAFRDDVLGEVTRLYFERQRIRLELDRSETGPERTRLELRAAELAAGLDAWTGGWFGRASRRVPEPFPPTPVPLEGDQP